MKLSIAFCLFGFLAACTSPSTPTGCDGIEIDPQKELVIVEPSVLQGPSPGLSFRHVAERETSGFVASILDAYAEVAPNRELPILSNWRDAGFDPNKAPLRLIAIANRLDLAAEPDDVGGAGEARLVFAVTDGPGDDPNSAELPMTIIFEYALGGDHRKWTADFHALSRYESFSSDYAAALEALVLRFPTLSQVRIDDAASGVRLYAELAPTANGLLAARGLRNTPEETADPSMLATLVTANAAAIADDKWLMPDSLRAKTIAGDAAWPLPGVAADTRTAFNAQTCSGCHRDGFQIAPGAVGTARLSTFLTQGEQARRAQLISTTLCAP